MYILEVEEEEEECEVTNAFEEEENSEELALSPQMSVHSLDGTSDYRTIRVKGGIKGRSVHILIDSGSTHKFMDLETTKRLG